MKFDNVSSAYVFYKTTPEATLEARTEAINTEIRSNADADIQALGIELEGIEAALRERRSDDKRGKNPGFTASQDDADDPAGTVLYRSAFHKHLTGGQLTAEELAAFERVNAEKRADAFNNLTNAAAVVPTTLFDQIIVKARDMGGLLSISRGFNIEANVRLPIMTPGDAAEWHTEGQTVESGKADPAYVEFNAYEIMKVLSTSVAVKTMSLDSFESYLADELNAAVMACLAKAMIEGTGVKQGLGIIPGITWEEGVNLMTIADEDWGDWKDITHAISMLHRGYARNAKFVMSNATLYQDVVSLHNDNNDPIYVFDLQNAHTGRLLGFDVVIDDYLPDHEILFGDWRFMGYNVPSGLMLDVSRDSSFKSGLIDYRAMCVADCKPIVEEAFIRITKGE